ncbi:unnamed protein product [Nesidiocoris tenuis]|uniref:DDE Tnp4 domain-containing protein n=3 Tax=Nesidiocoris tenuis TaxID=355587 RepID=A0A6H5GJ48_9HEMI|nr:unnamed protein product [Nesidiocoris tenuis]
MLAKKGSIIRFQMPKNLPSKMLSGILSERQTEELLRAYDSDVNRWRSAISKLMDDHPNYWNEDPRHVPLPVRSRVQSLVDLVAAPDEEFARHINVPRSTIKAVFESVELLCGNFEYNDLIMLLWYLSSESSNFQEIAKVCRVPNEYLVPSKLEEISSKLLRLKANGMMVLADPDEEEDIVEFFKNYAQLPGVIGALGVFHINCLDGSTLSIDVVVDHKQYFRHVNITPTTCVYIDDVLRSSPIYSRLTEEHSQGHTFLCPSSGYPTLPQLLPCIEGPDCALSPNHSKYALHHNRVVNVARNAVADVFQRFPKLERLEKFAPTTINAAFLLHNFCVQMKD